MTVAFKGHLSDVTSAAFSLNASTLVTGSGDGTVPSVGM